MPAQAQGTQAQKKCRPTEAAQGRGRMRGLAIHEDNGHRGVTSPSERHLTALVGVEVRAERGAEALVEGDHPARRGWAGALKPDRFRSSTYGSSKVLVFDL